ncbi:MAG TPA: PIN domain-containing protein [Casimicrobiaceae bacterium]|nr:PIN domain-containing protein [Casimicrobiaceae bacterium]
MTVILVDTSVWIDFIRPRSTNAVDRLRAALDHGIEAAVTPLIYQEVLQGARDEQAFRDYRTFLSTQPFLHSTDAVATHEGAARLYFECRRIGLTIRSSVDCLIAQTAVEHGVPLLHDNRDFERIATVAPKLEFA